MYESINNYWSTPCAGAHDCPISRVRPTHGMILRLDLATDVRVDERLVEGRGGASRQETRENVHAPTNVEHSS